MKRIKLLIYLMIIGFVFFIPINVSASPDLTIDPNEAEMSKIVKQHVIDKVNEGEYPEHFLNYLNNEYFQSYIYDFFYMYNNHGTKEEETVEVIEDTIETRKRFSEYSVYESIEDSMDLGIDTIAPNQIVGLYYAPDVFYNNKFQTCLFLIFSGKYMPSTMVYPKVFIEGDNSYELSVAEQYDKPLAVKHFIKQDLTLYFYPIYSSLITKYPQVELKQTYEIKGVEYYIDKTIYNGPNKNPNTVCELYNNGIINESIKFDLKATPKDKKILQTTFRVSELITDCAVQTSYDALFSGYKHYVYFNTAIDFDSVYRVDVRYLLTNDNKPWYEFALPRSERTVLKSLTADDTSKGFLGLITYRGISKGEFKSSSNDKIFTYRLHLNYDCPWWVRFIMAKGDERNYTGIEEFQILRINYVVGGQVFDSKVEMDPIDGDTLNIFDKDIIVNMNSIPGAGKLAIDNIVESIDQTVDNIVDNVVDVLNKTSNINGNTFKTIFGIIGGIIIVYFVFKGVYYVKILFNNKKQ